MSYTVLNAAAFKAQIAAQMLRIDRIAAQRLERTMKIAQAFAASKSPVYSGDFASNWNVSVGIPDTSFTATADYLGPEYPEPKTAPWGMGNFSMAGFKLGAPVFLTNAANHDEPYAWKIEKGTINFRPVNAGRSRVRAKTISELRRILGAL